MTSSDNLLWYAGAMICPHGITAGDRRKIAKALGRILLERRDQEIADEAALKIKHGQPQLKVVT